MQIKIKTDAKDIYKQVKWVYQSWSNEDLENMEFLQQNEWKSVFAHSKIWDDQLEVSKYENWRKYILPIECFDLENIENQQSDDEDEPTKLEVLKELAIKHKKDLIIGLIFLIFLAIAFMYNHKDKPKQEVKPQVIEQQKTVLEVLVEKQTLNLNKIWAKMETQKVIKSQINDLKIKLDQNITEIKALELENSTIKEQMIEETSNFNTKK